MSCCRNPKYGAVPADQYTEDQLHAMFSQGLISAERYQELSNASALDSAETKGTALKFGLGGVALLGIGLAVFGGKK
jgi:hypothetical protein